jgi:hypothetical protein
MKMRVRKNLVDIDRRLGWHTNRTEVSAIGKVINVTFSHISPTGSWYRCDGYRDWCGEELEPYGGYTNEEEL